VLSREDKFEGVTLTARQQQMAIRSAEWQKIIGRARELAMTGRFGDWTAIEDLMASGNELGGENPFSDPDLRQELDARCSTARIESRALVFKRLANINID
jgi:hypothetical protein